MSEVQEVKEDFQDIFEDQPEAEVEIVEEAAEETVEEAEETPVEQEPEATETEETAEESKSETTTDEKEPWQLSAVLDEREKRQKAVAEAKELREKLAEYEAAKDEDDVSIFEDEKGFTAKIDQKIAEVERNALLNSSEKFARREFGQEKVEAAKLWIKESGHHSPYVLEKINTSDDPYHELMEVYEADLTLRDPEAYKAQLREELLAELKEKKPKPSTPSLASKRSVGDKSDPEDFDDLLKD